MSTLGMPRVKTRDDVVWVVFLCVCSLLNKPTVPENGTHHTAAVTKARLGISETTCTSSGEYTSGDHGRQRD